MCQNSIHCGLSLCRLNLFQSFTIFGGNSKFNSVFELFTQVNHLKPYPGRSIHKLYGRGIFDHESLGLV